MLLVDPLKRITIPEVSQPVITNNSTRIFLASRGPSAHRAESAHVTVNAPAGLDLGLRSLLRMFEPGGRMCTHCVRVVSAAWRMTGACVTEQRVLCCAVSRRVCAGIGWLA